VQEGWGASTASTGKAGAAIDSAIVGVVDYVDLLPKKIKKTINGILLIMMERENAQNLAERIAALLQEKERGNGDDFLRASLEKINRRLDVIESNIGYQNSLNSTQTLSDYQPFIRVRKSFLT
jgi:hypothetical protein